MINLCFPYVYMANKTKVVTQLCHQGMRIRVVHTVSVFHFLIPLLCRKNFPFSNMTPQILYYASAGEHERVGADREWTLNKTSSFEHMFRSSFAFCTQFDDRVKMRIPRGFRFFIDRRVWLGWMLHTVWKYVYFFKNLTEIVNHKRTYNLHIYFYPSNVWF